MTSENGTDPYVEWGGAIWKDGVRRGLDWLGEVHGLRVLDLGTRYGRMATWFGLHGAHVLGVDISEDPLAEARRFAASNDVSDRVQFTTYSGDPRELPRGFDLIFSKSVVVLMDIERAVDGFATALNPGGRLLLVENARGPLPLHVARMIRRRSRRPHGASYFTRKTVEVIAARFDVQFEHWNPPVVVIGATVRG